MLDVRCRIWKGVGVFLNLAPGSDAHKEIPLVGGGHLPLLCAAGAKYLENPHGLKPMEHQHAMLGDPCSTQGSLESAARVGDGEEDPFT